MQSALLTKLSTILSKDYCKEYYSNVYFTKKFGIPTIYIEVKQDGIKVFLMLN